MANVDLNADYTLRDDLLDHLREIYTLGSKEIGEELSLIVGEHDPIFSSRKKAKHNREKLVEDYVDFKSMLDSIYFARLTRSSSQLPSKIFGTDMYFWIMRDLGRMLVKKKLVTGYKIGKSLFDYLASTSY